MRVAIARATPADVATITAVLAESFEPLRDLYTPAAFAATVIDAEAQLARLHHGPIWLAAAGGTHVGTISAVHQSDDCYVRGMGVLPSARRMGVGRALFGVVAEHAIEIGATRTRLHTAPFLSGAIALYESVGFVIGPNQDRPDLYGTPLIAMSRSVSL